jgi:alkylation response protein AidB-like acyl-CoA dehydrogenase
VTGAGGGAGAALDLDALVRGVGPTEPVRDIAEFFARVLPRSVDGDAAIVAATRVDRIAYAFTGGYAAAVSALVPGRAGLSALAATENKSAHPRAIETTLADDGTVTGDKSFVTLGTLAEHFLVVARTPSPRPDGRPNLKLVVVERDAAAGAIAVEKIPDTPFTPELPHARVHFDRAPASVLEGDGYERYLKPFRTVEDIYVHTALIAWLLAMAVRDGWGAPYVDRAKSVLGRSRALAPADPSSPQTHIELAACIDEARALAAGAAFSEARAAERAMWERDQPLLLVAERARIERLSRARAAIA